MVKNPHTYSGPVEEMNAYCMKCRKQVDVKDPKQITMKNGKPAVSGTCMDCGTKVFKIGKMQ